TPPHLPPFPTRRSSDLGPFASRNFRLPKNRLSKNARRQQPRFARQPSRPCPPSPSPARSRSASSGRRAIPTLTPRTSSSATPPRSEEHTSELQSPDHLV